MSSFTGKGEKTKGKGGGKGSKTKGAGNDAQKVLVFNLFIQQYTVEVLVSHSDSVPSCTRAVEQAGSSAAATAVGRSSGSCVSVFTGSPLFPILSQRGTLRSSVWPMFFTAVFMLQKQSSRLGVRPS